MTEKTQRFWAHCAQPTGLETVRDGATRIISFRYASELESEAYHEWLAIEQQRNENGISILPISLPHIWQLATLPSHHNDPFDRMLVAQAAADKLALVTADRHIARYPVELFW